MRLVWSDCVLSTDAHHEITLCDLRDCQHKIFAVHNTCCIPYTRAPQNLLYTHKPKKARIMSDGTPISKFYFMPRDHMYHLPKSWCEPPEYQTHAATPFTLTSSPQPPDKPLSHFFTRSKQAYPPLHSRGKILCFFAVVTAARTLAAVDAGLYE